MGRACLSSAAEWRIAEFLRRLGVTFWCLFVLSTASIAQTRSATEVNFSPLSLKGPAITQVKCLLQDQRGFLWIGTAAGLFRADGTTITPLSTTSPKLGTLMPNASVDVLAEDPISGNILIGSTTHGLYLYDSYTGLFRNVLSETRTIRGLKGTRVKSILPFKGNSFIITTEEGGHVVVSVKENNSLQTTGVKFASQPRASIRLPNGAFVVALADGTIFQYDSKSNTEAKPTRLDRVEGEPSGLAFQNGQLFVSTLNAGLIALAEKDHKRVAYTREFGVLRSPHSNRLEGLQSGVSGMLYFPTTSGLGTFSPKLQRFEHYSAKPDVPGSLPSNYVTCVLPLRDGVVLVGTTQGLVVLGRQQRAFTNLRNPTTQGGSARFSDVTAMARGTDGRIWIGSAGGMTVYDPITATFGQYQHNPANPGSLPAGSVTGLLFDGAQNLWVATYGGGLAVMEAGTFRFKSYVPGQFGTESSCNSRLTALLQDSKGNLWLGTDGTGLCRVSIKGTKATYLPPPIGAPTSGMVNAMAERNGEIFVATNKGLFIIQGEKVTRLASKKNGKAVIPTENIVSVLPAPDGQVYIGTYGAGLVRWNRKTDTYQSIDSRQGMPANVVNSLIMDRSGSVWAGTLKGLAHFPAARLEADAPLPTPVLFLEANGLPSERFNVNVASRAKDGSIFMGTAAGLVRFHPDSLDRPEGLARVIISAITQSGQPLELDTPAAYVQQLNLGPNENYLSFVFSVPNYGPAASPTIAYRLVGASENWLVVRPGQAVRFDALPPGQYRLQLVAQIPGVQGPRSELLISIRPPLTSTPRFILFIATISSGAFALFFLLRERRLQGQKRLLQDQVAAQTAKLTDTNIELESTLITLRETQAQVLEAERNTLAATLERRLSALVENSTDGIVLLSRSAKLIYRTMRAERISGLKLTPGVAVNFRSILLEGDFVKVLRVFTRARTQPSHSSTVQMRLNHPRRGLVWVEAVFTNLLHQPDVNAIVVNFRDITRRVNDEIKLQQLNDELSTLMYRASHDIRGPLASILGLVQVGIDESKDLASGHYFHLVKNSAQRLDILLSELLQAMQIKERQLSPRLVDWESLIHDAEIAAQEGLPTPLKPKEVIFSTKIDPTVKPFSTDIPVLTLLITHLVQNSIEYREVTRSKCEVLVEVTPDRVKGIRICVTDNGIGIPDEIAGHAFDMFVRGNVGKPGGGLGLYIVRTAAERLGGRVSLSSKVGEGTVVEVELPSINEV